MDIRFYAGLLLWVLLIALSGTLTIARFAEASYTAELVVSKPLLGEKKGSEKLGWC